MKPFLLLFLGLGGCYLRPASTNAPIHSRDGVEVALLGEDCEDHSGLEGEPVSRELGVKLRIDNLTGKQLRIRESEIRLVDGSTPVGAGERILKPRESAVFKLEFIHHLACYSGAPFVVEWNGAFVLEDDPLTVTSLSFKP
jgi:hypothetical protein